MVYTKNDLAKTKIGHVTISCLNTLTIDTIEKISFIYKFNLW